MSIVSNSIVIAAPASRIYGLAHATERWPLILPHYRHVRVLSETGGERVVDMAAWRGFIPVRWKAIQRDDPQTPAIHFVHISGWTKGMNVVWRFDENDGRTTVSIVHDLTFRFPVAAKFIERHVVSTFFIHAVATRTLSRMKELAESGYE